VLHKDICVGFPKTNLYSVLSMPVSEHSIAFASYEWRRRPGGAVYHYKDSYDPFTCSAGDRSCSCRTSFPLPHLPCKVSVSVLVPQHPELIFFYYYLAAVFLHLYFYKQYRIRTSAHLYLLLLIWPFLSAYAEMIGSADVHFRQTYSSCPTGISCVKND